MSKNTKEVKRKVGRPTMFSKKLAETICNRLAQGESLLKICEDKAMPAQKTVFLWLFKAQTNKDTFGEFVQNYADAREAWSNAVFEECFEISDAAPDVIVGDDKSDNARIQAQKLRVDTRKWALARMSPRKYGEKFDVTTKGKELPSQTVLAINYIKPKTKE